MDFTNDTNYAASYDKEIYDFDQNCHWRLLLMILWMRDKSVKITILCTVVADPVLGSWPGVLMHMCLSMAGKSHYLDGLVQGCSDSSTLAMALLQSCMKPPTKSNTMLNDCNITVHISFHVLMIHTADGWSMYYIIHLCGEPSKEKYSFSEIVVCDRILNELRFCNTRNKSISTTTHITGSYFTECN